MILLSIIFGVSVATACNFIYPYISYIISLTGKDLNEQKRIRNICKISMIVVIILSAGIGYSIYEKPRLPDEVRTECIGIYSTDLSSSVSGSFILGTGQTNSYTVYRFYTGNKSVGYTLKELPTSKSRIYPDENQNPYILHIWIVDPNTNRSIYGTDQYEFHLPETAIVRSYDVGLGGK